MNPTPLISSFSHKDVNKLAARLVTSPRLRGEVGICAPPRGYQVRGKRPSRDGGFSYNREEAPSPQPSPRKRGEGESCGSDTANV
jgi:hypothetical protein